MERWHGDSGGTAPESAKSLGTAKLAADLGGEHLVWLPEARVSSLGGPLTTTT